MTITSVSFPTPAPAGGPDSILTVRDLSVSFPFGARGRRRGKAERSSVIGTAGTAGTAGESGRPDAINAVRGLSFDIAKGQVLGIVGESGSGKSVTSTAIMGLLPSNAVVSGSVRFDGTELLGLGDKELSRLRGRRMSMVFQDPLSALTPVYSIGYQLAEAIKTHQPGVSDHAATRRAVELLDLVGIPQAGERIRAFPHEFSGGMRQRVVIAMAIANDPDLIICDEPTTALDVTIQAQILDVLKTARQETGAGIIMITHDLGVIAGLADRVVVMYAGKVVESGSVDEIYYRPRMPYTMGLLGSIPRLDATGRAPLVPIEGNPPSPVDLAPGCPFAPRCPMATGLCVESEPELVGVSVGGGGTGGIGIGIETSASNGAGELPHLSACHFAGRIAQENLTVTDVYPLPQIHTAAQARTPRGQRETVLEVTGLVKHHPLLRGAIFRRQVGTVRAVDGIDFDIKAAETVAIVGESGCGKSTTLLEVLNLTKPQGGRIVVHGKDTAALTDRQRQALRRDIQIVFQDPMASLDPRMPIGAIIAEPLTAHDIPREKIGPRVRELLQLVGLDPEDGKRYPQHFSGGQRQRIAIARALALEPRLLVLDEPVSALDVSIQAGVINLLEDLKGRLGLSYLFVAHDLAVVRHIADRVAIMYLGKIVEIGDGDSLFRAPRHPYTKALLSAIPIPDPVTERTRERILLFGDLPSSATPPSGCRFRTRCQLAVTLGDEDRARCAEEIPELLGVVGGDSSGTGIGDSSGTGDRDSAADGRKVACHFHDRDADRIAG